MSETTIETIVPPIVAEEPKSATVEDAEARIAALEAEKATILEREANYKMAYLKEKNRNEEIDPNESEETRIRRITREELAQSRLLAIDTEKEVLLKKSLKENNELKLALLNKTTPPATQGTHSETLVVTDTLVTPEQLAEFKKMGKDDKWIERYKQNLVKNKR